MKSIRGKSKNASDKIVSDISGGEFSRRRRTLLRRLAEDSPDKKALAIVFAAPTVTRNGDVEYLYRPRSDFAYLTGFTEPDAVAVFAPGRKEGEYILFCRPRDERLELWDGPRAGCRGAARDFGADQALPIEHLDKTLSQLAAGRSRVYLSLSGGDAAPRRLLDVLRGDGARHRAFLALEELTQEMRLRKSRAEIALMKKAAAVSVSAHRRAMRACRPGLFEYQLAAEIHYEFERAGAVPAYPSIVGGGANACILHYMRNGDALKDGDLVLIDAGAEYQLYASDVSRTFPVGGRFRPAQRDLYEIVLEAQRAAIAKVRPGNTWNDVHGAAVRVLTRGLVALGLLKGRVARLIADGAYQRFYMHRTGHWLGMDVHDVGGVVQGRRLRRFEPGMVLTVEPGLYLRAAADIPRRWRNVGIRIEDDVAVTTSGARVLSSGVPKEPDEVETLTAAAA